VALYFVAGDEVREGASSLSASNIDKSSVRVRDSANNIQHRRLSKGVGGENEEQAELDQRGQRWLERGEEEVENPALKCVRWMACRDFGCASTSTQTRR
jgi:hypothetical protein